MADRLNALGAGELVEVMTSFRAALSAHEQTINRLNVFPVPDGDTGTNMLATLDAVCSAIDALESKDALGDVCRAIAHGSLMGARGNSGVILCQILRGFVNARDGEDPLDAGEVARALRAASDAANGAVLRPVEGTILTVAREAADGAEGAAGNGAELPEVAGAARDGARDSVARTPELLSVLAEAGVVDAGGAGLTCLYDAIVHVVSGEEMPAALGIPESVALRVAAHSPSRESRVVAEPEEAIEELRYEVMYLLEAPDETIGAFKEVWGGIGDSIVVVGGEGLFNCHIHTNDIGAALEAALDVGRPREIRVTDLIEQIEEERWVTDASSADGSSADAWSASGLGKSVAGLAHDAPVSSVVAVCSGEGIRRIFHSLGVDHVVAGGQSMNPSTAEILAVIEAAPGAEVVVLPNNTNIYPVAAQAAELATKPVFVIETAGVQEGFAALLEYDPGADGEANAKAMGAAAHRVVAGEVTRAVRATSSPVGDVHEGDFIGLSRSGIESIAKRLSDATTDLLSRLLRPGQEIVTLVLGASVPPSEHRRVTEWLREEHPELSIEVLQGDQPLYPYFVSIE